MPNLQHKASVCVTRFAGGESAYPAAVMQHCMHVAFESKALHSDVFDEPRGVAKGWQELPCYAAQTKMGMNPK